MSSVKGKIVLVTGANRGIGKAIVDVFIKEGADKIYAAARNLESLNPLTAAYGNRIQPIHIDLNKPETIEHAAQQADDVEWVINNAGMLNVADPLSANAIEAMKQEMEVNVYGLMRISQAFAPVLEYNGGGVLVQLNSVASMKNFADFATYSASKAASYSITQALRDKLIAKGIRVLSVHPGPIDTDMARSVGLGELAEPAELVPWAILSALKGDDFHVYPDNMAKQIANAYQGFSSGVIDSGMIAG